MSEAQAATKDELIALAADIVSAYLGNNSVAAADLPVLIGSVHAALHATASGGGEPAKAAREPAVPIKKSVTADFIICLEDGKKFKSMKRHLRNVYNMTPDEYRTKWSLPPTYPMVAPNYSAARSALAKSLGLGQARARSRAAKAAPARTGPKKQTRKAAKA